jgi:hypothetical protein
MSTAAPKMHKAKDVWGELKATRPPEGHPHVSRPIRFVRLYRTRAALDKRCPTDELVFVNENASIKINEDVILGDPVCELYPGMKYCMSCLLLAIDCEFSLASTCNISAHPFYLYFHYLDCF